MFAQYDVFFTGQLVFGLTAILGLASLAMKVLGRKAAEPPPVRRDEFCEFREQTARQFENLGNRVDDARDRVLTRMTELQAQLARLDERTK